MKSRLLKLFTHVYSERNAKLSYRAYIRGLGLATACAALAARLAAADPLIACQIAKLTASDGATFDFFGNLFSGLSIDGDTVVVGAGNNAQTGAAYIFERNAGGMGNWGEVKKLTASDGAANDRFGDSSACLRGDTLVILASGKNSATGAAYIFERNAGGMGNWGQVKKLTASDGVAGDVFGDSASLSGDTLVIGAPGVAPRTLFGAGAAYVFERNAGGPNNWGQVKKITGSDVVASDRFSAQGGLSISGDTLVGTVKGTAGIHGVAYVFKRDAGGPNNWGQVKKIDNGAFNLGFSPSISGDTLAVGAPSENFMGAVYVFERNAGGPENWGQVKRLTPSGAGEDDFFGRSLFLSSDRLLVGATGAGPHDDMGHSTDSGEAYVFDRNAGGAENWGQVTEFTGADVGPGTQFGAPVSFSARAVVVGTTVGNTRPEAVYLFELNHPPTAICRNVTKSADGSCQAAVTAAEVDNGSSDPDGDPITLTLTPAGPYPLGTTTVTLTVADNYCGAGTCTATVTVVDQDPPLAACGPAQPPVAAAGQNPNGFYQLFASDNCDSNPEIFIQDSASGFLAGPFASGDVVKITQSNAVGSKPAPAHIVAHLLLRGDALLYGVDASGNVSASVSCLVPPPPK